MVSIINPQRSEPIPLQTSSSQIPEKRSHELEEITEIFHKNSYAFSDEEQKELKRFRRVADNRASFEKEIDHKYTRKKIDKEPIVDVGSDVLSQFHILQRMIRSVPVSKRDKEKLLPLFQCMARSEKFFQLRVLIRTTSVENYNSALLAEMKELKPNESFIFPAGPKQHATIFEVTKVDDTTIQVRHYNSGYGGQINVIKQQLYMVMPLYQFPLDELSIENGLLAILKLRYDDNDKYNSVVENIILKNLNGHRVREENPILHKTQDQSNCSWKPLSNWFSDRTKDVIVRKNQKYNQLVKKTDYELLQKHVISEVDEYIDDCTDVIKRFVKESYFDRQSRKIQNKVTK